MSEMQYKTVGDAHAELQRRGFDKTFEAAEDGLRCKETGRLYRTHDGMIQVVYRFEAESDPAEMSVVYALEMNDGEKGTIIDAFGPYSNAELGEVLKNIPVSPVEAVPRVSV